MKRKISKIAIGLFVAAWCSLFPFGMITAYADTTDVNASKAQMGKISGYEWVRD